MFSKTLVSLVAAVSILWMSPAAIANSPHSQSNSNAHNRVAICHATGSQTNPYVRITPNANGVINGHVGHQDGRDIIPPFTYNSHSITKHFPGKNWNSNGKAIFNNGCRPVSQPANQLAGGQGSSTQGQVSGAQVIAPVGGVAAGVGGTLSPSPLVGIVGLASSFGVLGFGLRRLSKQ